MTAAFEDDYMITQEQAAAMSDAILRDGSKLPTNDWRPPVGEVVAILAVVGIAVGVLVGVGLLSQYRAFYAGHIHRRVVWICVRNASGTLCRRQKV